MIFTKTICDVFAHASCKCLRNSCFEWAWVVILLTLSRLSCLLDGSFLDGCLLWASQEMLFILLTLGKSKNNFTTKLPQQKLYAWAYLGHQLVSLALHPGFSDLWRSPPALSSTPTWDYFILFECLSIQFFNLHSHVTYGMPCHARGHSHSCLGKQRISPGVAIILAMCLCSHT